MWIGSGNAGLDSLYSIFKYLTGTGMRYSIYSMIDSKFSIQYKVLNSMRYDRFELYCTVQYSTVALLYHRDSHDRDSHEASRRHFENGRRQLCRGTAKPTRSLTEAEASGTARRAVRKTDPERDAGPPSAATRKGTTARRKFRISERY